MTTEKIGYDALYKRVLGTARHLAQFLQAFDPQTADALRLDSIEPRGTELFDVLLIHVEVQRTKQQHFGQRMLDYYT